MNILTIGPSPFLLTREGRVNRDVIRGLKDNGYHVECLATHYEASYFLPDSDGIHYYEHTDGTRTRLHPYLNKSQIMPVHMIEVMKQVRPNLVILIGDYSDVTSIYHIKRHYPDLFKLMLINTSGVSIVNENYKEQLNVFDSVVSTSLMTHRSMSAIVKQDTQHIQHGPDTSVFYENGNRGSDFRCIMRSHNRQNSNLGAFIKAISDTKISSTLHTNMDDPGDVDIRLLMKRYSLKDILRIPDKFVSVCEGIDDFSLNDLYNRHHVVVDCSLQSGTAMSVLEAMSTGCIPVGMEFGAIGEIISQLPKELQFFVNYETFIGPGQEDHAIISSKNLGKIMAEIKWNYESDKNWFSWAKEEVKNITKIFSKERFVKRLNNIVENVLKSEHAMVVDSY